MKKIINFHLISIGLLFVSSILLSHSTIKVLFNPPREPNFVESDFSYIDKKNNKNVGFENVKFKQFDFYNYKTDTYEYFLNDYGKKYLIKRFKETTIIGPEISALKSIVIGDTIVIKKTSLGEYYSISNSIFINIFPLLKMETYRLWHNKDVNNLQERRAEAILSILVHEYYHHLFSSYGSSPIGHPSDRRSFLNLIVPNPSDPLHYVKKISSKIENKTIHKSIWNKWFYNYFKRLFFANGISRPKALQFLERYRNYVIKLKNNLDNLDIKQHLENVIDSLTEIINNEKQMLYNYFPNVGNIFKWSNENTHLPINGLLLNNQDIFSGIIIDYHKQVSKSNIKIIPKLPIIYKINYQKLSYFYSMEEQVVRKLLLATFLPLAKYKSIIWEYLKDYLLTNNYFRDPQNPENNPWQPFYTDNVYPSNSMMDNRSKLLVENIIRPLMGHDNYSNLSFITSKDSWSLIDKSKIMTRNIDDAKNDHKNIKIGGFTNNHQFNYIGYKNKDNSIVKFPIENKKFSIWYKNQIESENKINVDEAKFYWYTKNFIPIDKIINKKLFFFQVNEENGNIILEKAFTSLRKNNFGVVNSFNEGMIQNSWFVKNTMNKGWNDTGGKWLIVGDDSDGIRLKFHNKQEKIEKIWT